MVPVVPAGESPIHPRFVRALRILERTPGPLVLAVSGGADSMALLDLVSRCPMVATRSTVATFDHGTGPFARRAVRLVRRESARRGIPVIAGRAPARGRPGTEAGWRAERWAFLGRVAARLGARVVTAHSQDDQIETVVLRMLRHAGPRGLAGLAARSVVCRPLLHVSRARVRRYVRVRAIPAVRDPGNRSRQHARNRVRHDLLPAIARVNPNFGREMVRLGRRAAAWREDLELLVDAMSVVKRPSGDVRIAAVHLRGYDLPSLGILWAAIAARAGAVLDWRGTRRVAAFTTAARCGDRMPLSGGWEVVCTFDGFLVRRASVAPPDAAVLGPGGLDWNGWEFRPLGSGTAGGERGDDLWSATFPGEGDAVVRAWRGGDRIRAGTRTSARRVKRYFTDMRISGPERDGWPVVVVQDEIVWVPGVCRSDAATVRSGRPGRAYRCERC